MLKPLTLLVLTLTFHQLYCQKNKEPLARYTFNSGQALNEVSPLNPGIEGASFVEDRFGNEKSAVYLHGNPSSYINLGTNSSLKPTEASISMWVNVDLIMHKGTGYDYNPILITKSHAGNDFYEGYFIGLNFTTNRLNVTTSKDSLNQITLNSTHALKLRTWHHIVMTYDDNFLSLYLDNDLQARVPKKFKSTFLSGDSIIIGNSANKKNERYLCGSVDDISIYDRVISREEVSVLYEAPNPNRYNIYFKWLTALFVFVIILLIISKVISRRLQIKLKKEQEKNEITAKLNKLETKVIRTQMNPHFMFNSLNTLQRFILEKDMDSAHLYLTKFSKLLRKILESSTSDSMSLSEEIEILNHYVELECLRSENSFSYQIINKVQNPEKTLIPIMLVQPFVENAIWHGLMAKKENRQLTVTFESFDDARISCTVDDTGVGREHSYIRKDPIKKKSLATEFIKQRLELTEKTTGIPCYFEIIDKKNDNGQSLGTMVTIIIPKTTNV